MRDHQWDSENMWKNYGLRKNFIQYVRTTRTAIRPPLIIKKWWWRKDFLLMGSWWGNGFFLHVEFIMRTNLITFVVGNRYSVTNFSDFPLLSLSGIWTISGLMERRAVVTFREIRCKTACAYSFETEAYYSADFAHLWFIWIWSIRLRWEASEQKVTPLYAKIDHMWLSKNLIKCSKLQILLQVGL